jgi:glucokinase
MEVTVLIGDLGGTNCRFQLHRLTPCPKEGEAECSSELLCQMTYPTVPSADAVPGCSCFEALVRLFLDEHAEWPAPDLCVLAVCGPVVEGAAYCASQRMMEVTTSYFQLVPTGCSFSQLDFH